MPWCENFDRVMGELCPTLPVLREEPMAGHITFRVGGPARRLVYPRSQEELVSLLDHCVERGWPYFVFGNGSNLLVTDAGLDAVAICVEKLDQMERQGDDRIWAQAGVMVTQLALLAQREGLDGFTFSFGIPGTLGGAVCMNAGAYGGEMSQVLSAVTAWFPRRGILTLTPEQLRLSYRHSVFFDEPGVVLSAELALRAGDPAKIRQEMDELMRRRREKQPLEFPSAGSTFKRPEGYFAGTLIEQCGLKGLQIGGARVSEKHAGFIVNCGGATGGDILQLIDAVQAAVLEKTGVRLEPEVKIIR